MDERGYYASINVYRDPLQPHGWTYSVRHNNGGEIISGVETEAEAWRRARASIEWHRIHPFGPVSPANPEESEERP
jgi:hypothetical protein